MLKKTITYTDYNGELMEMEMSTEGGLAERIQKVVDTKDVPSIIKIFKDLVLKAYGEKSADGKRFIKSKELSEAFAQTEAYSILFMELASDADEASKFINGIVPTMPQNAIPAKAK